MTSTPGYPHLISYSFTPPDLNSRKATQTPDFAFATDATQSEQPIVLLSTQNPFATCLQIKSWLLEQHRDPAYAAPGILRMEYLELDRMERGREGWVVVAPDVVRSSGLGVKERRRDSGVEVGGGELGQLAGGQSSAASEGKLNVSIVAVLVKSDPRVRWFYTLLPASSLLTHLIATHKLARIRRALDPPNPEFWRIHTWLQHAFLSAVKIPESRDWLNAQTISDYCSSILDPDGALGRLEAEKGLYWSTPGPEEFLLSSATPNANDQSKESPRKVRGARDSATPTPNSRPRPTSQVDAIAALTSAQFDPSDDRYLLHLHPAERELASLARFRCAEYLFIKRNFFRACWEELYRSDILATELAREGRPEDLGRGGRTDGTRARGRGNAGDVVRNDTPFEGGETPAPDGDGEGDGTPATIRRGRGRRGGVRTERVHQLWLQEEYHCKAAQAKTLVVGWRVLGFLDERRYLGWLRDGWGADEQGQEGMEEV